jgi:hypothetical protein
MLDSLAIGKERGVIRAHANGAQRSRSTHIDQTRNRLQAMQNKPSILPK